MPGLVLFISFQGGGKPRTYPIRIDAWTGSVYQNFRWTHKLLLAVNSRSIAYPQKQNNIQAFIVVNDV